MKCMLVCMYECMNINVNYLHFFWVCLWVFLVLVVASARTRIFCDISLRLIKFIQ